MKSLKRLIGQRIRVAREMRGFTQGELGDCLNLTGGSISKIEAGKSTITLESLELLPKVLDFPLEYFLGLGSHQDGLTPTELEVLYLYRALSPDAQCLTLAALRAWQSDRTRSIIGTISVSEEEKELAEILNNLSSEQRAEALRIVLERRGVRLGMAEPLENQAANHPAKVTK